MGINLQKRQLQGVSKHVYTEHEIFRQQAKILKFKLESRARLLQFDTIIEFLQNVLEKVKFTPNLFPTLPGIIDV